MQRDYHNSALPPFVGKNPLVYLEWTLGTWQLPSNYEDGGHCSICGGFWYGSPKCPNCFVEGSDGQPE